MASNYIRLPGEAPPRYDTPMGEARNAEAKTRMAAQAKAAKPAAGAGRSTLDERLSEENEIEGGAMRPNVKAVKKLAGGFSVRDYSVPGDPHR